MKSFLIFLVIAIANTIFCQENVVLNNANSLSGKVIDGQEVRIAEGNVSFTQGNIKVYCNSATQYISQNKVELRGNVRIFQDTLSLFTSKATYLGNERQAFCENGVTLKDPSATLRADKGIYYFNESKAIFTNDVIIINPTYKITANQLTYFRFSEDSFAKGNVIVTTDSTVIKAENIDFFKRQGKTFAREKVSINSDSTIITSDSLTNFSFENKSIAEGNVKIVSLNHDAIITGNYLENFEDNNYSKLLGNCKLVHSEENKDTVYIYSNKMEAFRNSPEHYIAEENVELIRGEFLSKCGLGVYFKTNETVSLSKNPIVWQNNIQATADTIYADLPGNMLQKIYLMRLEQESILKPFVLSQNQIYGFHDRYDQISSNSIILHFQNDKINFIETKKSSESIYYIYEDSLANGVNKTEGEYMNIYFDDQENVSQIVVQENPKGQYIPENQIFNTIITLPGFNPRSDKPFRK